jgi:hypothetical protein
METQEIRKSIEEIIKKINNESLKVAVKIIKGWQYKTVEEILESFECIIKISEIDKELSKNCKSSSYSKAAEELEDVSNKLGIKNLYFIVADLYLCAAKTCEHNLTKTLYFENAKEALKKLGYSIKAYPFQLNNEKIEEIRAKIRKDLVENF